MKDGDGEGAYSFEGRIFLRIGHKLLSKAKFDCAHAVESWVRGPHGREDLSHGAEVLFHTSFVYGFVVRCEDSYADLVSEDL